MNEKLLPATALQAWAFLTRPGLGVLISLASLIVAISYAERPDRKEPVFLSDARRVVALKADEFIGVPIRFFRIRPLDGVAFQPAEAITQDLTAVQVCFWNNGRSHIRREDLLMGPLRIQVADAATDIFHQELVSVSDEDAEIQWWPDPNSPHQLLLSFKFLGQHDGFLGKLFIRGSHSARLTIKGKIADVITISQSEFGRFREPQLTFSLILLTSLVLWSILGVGRALLCKEPMRRYLIASILCAGVALWIGMGIWTAVRPYSIPESILSSQTVQRPAPAGIRP